MVLNRLHAGHVLRRVDSLRYDVMRVDEPGEQHDAAESLDVDFGRGHATLIEEGRPDAVRDQRVVEVFTGALAVRTTFPNEVSGTVHHRMPVVVQPKDYQRWLDQENEDVADIIAPPPSESWIAYPVNRRVNSPKNNDAELIEPERA